MNKELKLITESAFETQIIKEASEKGRPHTIKMKGVYIIADQKNGNNRIYEYETLKPEVDKFIEEKINTNSALEELEHPTEITINPMNVCARTIELVEDNKQWIGTSVVLATDEKNGIKGTVKGDLLAGLLNYDCACGHSTRGAGTVEESTGIVKDYQMVCIDTVLSPSIGIFNKSNATRFVNGILESKTFITNVHGEIIGEKFNEFEKVISKMPNTNITSKRNEFLHGAVTDFLKSLNENVGNTKADRVGKAVNDFFKSFTV